MSVKVNIDLSKELSKEGEKRKKIEMEKLVNSLRDATPVDTGRARAGWKVEENKIINDVEYIDELNAGSSKQAPSHFIERTLLANRNVSSNGTIVVPK
jgi:hypothetical protein